MLFENCDKAEYNIPKKTKKNQQKLLIAIYSRYPNGKCMVKLTTNRKFNASDLSKPKKMGIITSHFNIF